MQVNKKYLFITVATVVLILVVSVVALFATHSSEAEESATLFMSPAEGIKVSDTLCNHVIWFWVSPLPKAQALRGQV